MRRSPEIGIVEWFEPGEFERVERVLAGLDAIGVRHLRTGLSWAGYATPGGPEWYDWLLPRIARDVEVLPCVVSTRPSLEVASHTEAPPRDLRDYADFLELVLNRYGKLFDHVELWSEPNEPTKWERRLDPDWSLFCATLGEAARCVRRRGKRTVLGGMSPLDIGWLRQVGQGGVLEQIDVLGLHGFPRNRQTSSDGWPAMLEAARSALAELGCAAEVWITESGFSTWSHDEHSQVRELADALAADAGRVYWYAAEDLGADGVAATGLHRDERDHHFGLRRADGSPKLLARVWEAGGLPEVRRIAALAPAPSERRHRRVAALITGGAGFVGTNLAHRLLEDGHRVRVFDSLARPGVERNLRWLLERHPGRVDVELADVRDRTALRRALGSVDQVFHFAAQVAVTTSLDDPFGDFSVNVQGTVNLLEELRRLDRLPPLVFTSTNKVYGTLPDLQLELDDDRWLPRSAAIREQGLDETRPLDFCTPYGCSKGAADQYVLDYAKSFGIPAVVFRMSCIYGPHQHGTEDQGWVAHFLLRALAGEPITIYGDGAQVRDLLWVEDLVEAFVRVRDASETLAGTAFNVGGGPQNAVSLLNVVDLIEDALGRRPEIELAAARQGDQRYYVAASGRLLEAVGWRPRVGVEEGVEQLARWLQARRAPLRSGVRVAAR